MKPAPTLTWFGYCIVIAAIVIIVTAGCFIYFVVTQMIGDHP